MLASVIITTYNRPKTLKLVLEALNYQTDREFEVIIADDGSTKETSDMVMQMMLTCNYPITHVYQKDLGFRAARVRNLGAMKAKGDYLIFLDGDCIPRNNFIAMHKFLSEKKYLVCGNRVLLSEEYTKFIEDEHQQIYTYSLAKLFYVYLKGGIKRFLPLVTLKTKEKFRKLKFNWKKARSCNFALYKEDFLNVDGFDSTFEGWGYEDSDFAIRLIHSGVEIKSGRYATACFHMYHKENDHTNERDNFSLLEDRLHSDIVKAAKGMSTIVKEE
ncbi:MAG: glycosyltransferase [Aeromonadales bacterium]|nr:glycosyltransferase [Aeromonadales bacterium]